MESSRACMSTSLFKIHRYSILSVEGEEDAEASTNVQTIDRVYAFVVAISRFKIAVARGPSFLSIQSWT